MRIPRTRLNDIVRGKRGITADTALHLAQFFGGSAIFCTNLQGHYDLAEAEEKAGKKSEKYSARGKLACRTQQLVTGKA